MSETPPSAPEVHETAAQPADDVRDFNRQLHQLTPRTPVTWGVFVVNLVVFAAMVMAGVDPIDPSVDELLAWGADYGVRTTNGEWWRLFTSMFIHIGVLHLALNLWVLLQIGRFVERLVGSVGLCIVYVLSGLCGSLASVLWNPMVVSAGASGAVFGLFGVLLGFLLRRRNAIPLAALRRLLRSALYFVGYNLLFGFAVQFVNNAAHLGGLMGGFALGYLIALPITPEGCSRRNRAARNVALGGLCILVGVAALTPRTADLNAETDHAWQTFDRVRETYNALVARNEAGELSDSDFGQRIEEQIVPPLRDIQLHFAQLGRLPAEHRPFARKVQQLIEAHLDFYTSIARGAPTRDERLLDQAVQADERMQALFRELSSN